MKRRQPMISPSKQRNKRQATRNTTSEAGAGSSSHVPSGANTGGLGVGTRSDWFVYEDDSVVKDTVTIHSSTPMSTMPISEEHVVSVRNIHPKFKELDIGAEETAEPSTKDNGGADAGSSSTDKVRDVLYC